MRKIILLFLIVVFQNAMAQEDLTMRLLPQLQESGWSMPCNRTDAKISIGLPLLSSMNFNVFSNGFTYHQLFKNVGDTTYLQLGNVINNLKTYNFVGFGTAIPIFNFTITKNNFSYGFSVADKLVMQMTYPGDLFKLLWNGNGSYIGQTLELGNFGVNAMYYREYALHFSMQYKSKWTFGINPKMLFGKSDIHTAASSLTLYTDPSYYQMTAAEKLNIQTSGIPNIDSSNQKNIDGKYVESYLLNTANKGFAVDLAARYEFKDNIAFAAGINDLGFINWRSNIYNVTSDVSSFTFDGIHAQDFFQNDTSSTISSQKYLDSVSSKLKLQHNYDHYRTMIPMNFYAMATYQLTLKHKFSAMFNWYHFEHQQSRALTLGYQFKLSKHLAVVATYTGKSRSAFNLGGGLIFQFLNMQWYFVTDNWWAAIRPLDSKNVNLRFGVNIVWGDTNKKKEIAPMPVMEEKKN